MSIREARLCDAAGCNNPALFTCELCNRDCCGAHLGDRSLYITVLQRAPDANAAEHLGKTEQVRTCKECDHVLYRHTVALTQSPVVRAFAELVEPLRDKLIEAAAAFIAEQKLAKKPEK